MKKLLLSLLVGTLFSSLCFADPGFWESGSSEEVVTRLLDEMSDEEMLGQLFMFGFRGTTPSREIMDFISEHYIGGIKIFGWNVSTLPRLVKTVGEMQKKAEETPHQIPLLIATDQEGGWVRHVKEETSITPGNLAIGATGLPYDAYMTGYYIGQELKALGINMNFAPTVDVYTNPAAHVIGPRAFSQDPVMTGQLAVAYYHGMKEAGVICTAKHFPGHGNADKDSHGALPIIKSSLDELWENDLVPYRFLVKEGVPAIMSGHLAFPEITGDETPSSLSAFFQTELLRDRLGFEGLLITDDLRMHGVTQTGFGDVEIARRAVESGADIIMLSGTPELQKQVCERFLSLMKTDKEFHSRVREAAKRVLTVKADYLRGESSVPLYPDEEQLTDHIPNPEGKKFFFELACRSVTVIREELLPFRPEEEEKVLLTGQYREFIEAGKNRYPQADEYYFPYSPFYYSLSRYKNRLVRMADRYDTIVFCLSNPNSLDILKSLEETEAEIIVFSVLTPIYLRETSWVKTAIAAYGVGEDSFNAGFAVLAGDYKAESTLPISITSGEH